MNEKQRARLEQLRAKRDSGGMRPNKTPIQYPTHLTHAHFGTGSLNPCACPPTCFYCVSDEGPDPDPLENDNER
jgi:hypothetical protein